MKVVSIQHGDYRHALELEQRDKPEDYFAQRYSIRITRDLIGVFPNLIISLDAPHYRETKGNQTLIGLPALQRVAHFPGTGLLAAWVWGKRILDEVKRFQPDRLLLRTGNPWICNPLLGYAKRNNISVLVLMANTLSNLQCTPSGLIESCIRKKLIQYLNRPNVIRVGNHRVVAARSLLRAGVDADKVVSYDFPGSQRPDNYLIKEAPQENQSIRILFAGILSKEKGIEDLVNSFLALARRGINFEARVFGTGPYEKQLLNLSKSMPSISVEGLRSNAEVFEAMRESHVVVVPSRHSFAEGLPFTITEALASRTPVICSDHPVFIEAFVPEEGVVYFPSKNAELLARAIVEVTRDKTRYRRLSESTAPAFNRVSSETTAGDLINLWIHS